MILGLGLALLWTAVLGGTAPSPPRLRLSFQGKRIWQVGVPAQGRQERGLVWAGVTEFSVGPPGLRGPPDPEWTESTRGPPPAHPALASVPCLSAHILLCFLSKPPPIPMATDPASAPSAAPLGSGGVGALRAPFHTPYLGVITRQGQAGWQRTLSLIWGLGFWLSLRTRPSPEPRLPRAPAWRRRGLSEHAPGARPALLPLEWGCWLCCPPWKLRTWAGLRECKLTQV